VSARRSVIALYPYYVTRSQTLTPCPTSPSTGELTAATGAISSTFDGICYWTRTAALENALAGRHPGGIASTSISSRWSTLPTARRRLRGACAAGPIHARRGSPVLSFISPPPRMSGLITPLSGLSGCSGLHGRPPAGRPDELCLQHSAAVAASRPNRLAGLHPQPPHPDSYLPRRPGSPRASNRVPRQRQIVKGPRARTRR